MLGPLLVAALSSAALHHQARLAVRPRCPAVHAAAVDERDEKGETPLIVAAELGDVPLVASLLQEGADASAASYSGWTAMHGAAECGSVGVIAALAGAGADVSAVAGSGKTPLDIARQYGQPDAVSALLERGATANKS